jgi:hypothetical protein
MSVLVDAVSLFTMRTTANLTWVSGTSRTANIKDLMASMGLDVIRCGLISGLQSSSFVNERLRDLVQGTSIQQLTVWLTFRRVGVRSIIAGCKDLQIRP